MNKWGNVRVLNALIHDVKTAIQHNGRFSNVSDFVTHAMRTELEKMQNAEADEQ